MTQKVTPLPGGGSVVEDPEDIDNPILAFFLTRWRRHRGDQPLPPTVSFLPKEIGSQLPWVCLADALPDYQDFRFRLVGSRVCEYFLTDGTGMTVREAFADLPDRGADGLVWIYRQACVERYPIRFTGPGGIINGISFPDFDCGYFPYTSDGVSADRVVVVFTFNYLEFARTRSMVSLLVHT